MLRVCFSPHISRWMLCAIYQDGKHSIGTVKTLEPKCCVCYSFANELTVLSSAQANVYIYISMECVFCYACIFLCHSVFVLVFVLFFSSQLKWIEKKKRDFNERMNVEFLAWINEVRSLKRYKYKYA